MNRSIQRDDIIGWGADLDPANRPAYPKERTPPRFINPHWKDPEQQVQTVRIFHSTERPRISRVFGTTVPPRWVSGKLRQVAFKFSENDIRHWLILLFADRVDMVEGIVDDLAHGHIPNIFAEMGIKSEFKYNKKGLVKKALIVGGIAGLVAYYFKTKRSQPVY
jgi:hypothetical protein